MVEQYLRAGDQMLALSEQQEAAGNLAHAQLLAARPVAHFHNTETLIERIPAIHLVPDSGELGQVDKEVDTQEPRKSAIGGVLGHVDVKIKLGANEQK